MSDLIDYGELYKSLDETAREIMIEHFGFPKNIMPCCANCEYYNGGVHCIRELGAVSDDNNFCILYKPCSTSHKDNNSGILTSDLRDFVNEYESDHNVHLYSEVANTEYGDSGLNIYMFDDDYYETKMCVGCFISDKTFEFIWNAGNDGMQSVFLLEKYIKVVFDELYYHLYHDECDALEKDLPYIYVIMYSFFAYYDYTSYQIECKLQKINDIGVKG